MESETENSLNPTLVQFTSNDTKQNTGYRLQHELEPMKNPVILDHLFELCPANQLAPLRLVCKDYYSISLASWRSKVEITFRAEAYHPRTYPAKQRVPFLRKFLDYIRDPKNACESKPYCRFSLQQWYFKKTDKNLREFFSICGPHITHLELLNSDFRNAETFRKIIFSAVPNLQRLVVKDYQFEDWLGPPYPERREYLYEIPNEVEQKNLKSLHIDMNHEPLPLSWVNILSHFPNLEDIQLRNADRDEVVQMLEAVATIRKKHKKKLELKQLDILSADLYAQNDIPPAVCELLHDLKLPIESLTMDFGSNTAKGIIHNVLDTHSKTLRKLDVYRAPMARPFKDFPFGVNLEALQELTFSDRLTSNLGFLKFTPNLRKLSIYDKEENATPIVDCDIVKNTLSSKMETVPVGFNVKELRIEYNISQEDIKHLVHLLPNVKKLTMPLNDGKFSEICENWRSLEEIEVLGSELTDYGVTGRNLLNQEEVSTGEILPNISCLKNLYSFKMNTFVEMSTRLMDSSAFHGFLLCPNLRVLEIASQMGDEARNALYERIPDCTITRYETDSDSWTDDE